MPGVPGLYFVGLQFLYAFSSAMVHGVGRDAERVADAVASRSFALRTDAGDVRGVPGLRLT